MSESGRRWTIVIGRQPQKEMRWLPHDIRQQVDQAILALATEPRPMGYKPVENAPKGTYRVRVGRYRVIYIILDDEQTIIVTKVRKKDESTYKEL